MCDDASNAEISSECQEREGSNIFSSFSGFATILKYHPYVLPEALELNSAAAGLSTSLVVTLLAGCANLPQKTSSPDPVVIRGTVQGGQQPIKGAAVQLYAAGTSGDGAAAFALLTSPPLTNAQGGFSLPAFTCPSADTPMYLVASGGDPGTGKNNPAIALMVALGPCGALASIPYVAMNEVTTVASIFPISPFMSSYAATGSTMQHAAMLASDFAAVNAFVDITHGTSPGPAFTTGLTIPVAEIYTLADVIASCVNSTGGVSGDGSGCGDLFLYATPSSGAAPTNTVDALVEIAKNPTLHTSDLFYLASAKPPFQPILTSPPNSWSIIATPNVVERPKLLAEYLLNEGAGSVAHDTSGLGNDATINGPSWEGSADLNFDNLFEYVQLPTAINAAKTLQFAAYFPVFGSGALPQAPGYGQPASFGANASIFCGTDTSQLCLIANSVISGSKSIRFSAFNTDGTEASAPIDPGWHIFTLICGGVTGGGVVSNTHYLYDGVEVSGYVRQGAAGTCPVPSGGNYQIGGSSLYYYSWFLGKIGAAWAWNAPLTLEEGATAAASALNYLKAKGVVTSFSNVDITPPVVIGGFDSRTYGAGVSPSTVWLATMSLTDPAFTRVNLGLPGQYAYDACNQFDLTYGEQIPVAAAGSTITLLWGGVNDFLYSGQTPQQVADSLECMVRKGKAKGSRVVLATEISFIDSNPSKTAGDTQKGVLDNIIRANAFSWGADNIADLATDPHIGADGASSSSPCFVDGVHPGQTCEVFITAIMQNAVNELLGSTATNPTATAASAYQEQAGDDFLRLTGASVQAVTLPSCIGYSLPRTITNAGSSTATVVPISGESLMGSTSVGSGLTATISPVPGPTNVGGCSWSRTK